MPIRPYEIKREYALMANEESAEEIKNGSRHCEEEQSD